MLHCPNCKSDKVRGNGQAIVATGDAPRRHMEEYQCKECSTRFILIEEK